MEGALCHENTHVSFASCEMPLFESLAQAEHANSDAIICRYRTVILSPKRIAQPNTCNARRKHSKAHSFQSKFKFTSLD